MKKRGDRKRAAVATTPLMGKDEMNFSEFPIATVSHSIPEDCNQLIFEDEIRDQATGKMVHRKLTVTGDAVLGLPNPLDDDVLMVLMLITKQRDPNFHSRTVPYSRMEIIELLGWPINGQSVNRLEESLTRWHGVKLDWEKAWWCNRTNTWRNEKFHILDNISNFDLMPVRRSKQQLDQSSLPFCSFTWNEVLFNSFRAGYLRTIDLGFYFQLSSAISKRAFRFLDKRFYRESALSMDLKTFACNKIGLSNAYSPTKMKAKLQPALDELEQFGFLEPLSREKRYEKVSHGVWKIVLTRGDDFKQAKLEENSTSDALKPVQSELDAALNPLVSELTAYGVTPALAVELARKHDAGTIRTYIELLEYEMSRKPEKVKDPAAWLFSSFRDGRSIPKGFTSKADRERQAEAKRLKERQEAEARGRKQHAEHEERRIAQQIAKIRQNRSPDQLARFEADAIALANEDTRRSLSDPVMKRFRETRITLLVNEHLARLIRSGEIAEPA